MASQSQKPRLTILNAQTETNELITMALRYALDNMELKEN